MDVTRGTARWRRHGWALPLAALMLLTVLAPASAWAQGAGPDTVRLVWTAPGDDGLSGTATAYELRYSTSQINASNWSGATLVAGVPAPLPAGSAQSTVVRGLTYGTTYYFAIRAVDNAGNWSDLSNVVRWEWSASTAAPAAPRGVRASKKPGRKALVSWSPNAEPDLAGYTVYRALDASGPYSRLNTSLITATEFDDNSIPVEATAVWYEVTATDATGNESARSSAAALSLVEATTWAMEPAYPNPSRAGTTVHIPLVAPGGGGTARIEIFNNGGQRVRLLELGAVGTGNQVLQWDGLGDNGREVAPGVYTARLIAGGTRLTIRLVRVP